MTEARRHLGKDGVPGDLGTVSIGLIGEEFVFERYVEGRWTRDPASPRAFTKIRLGILSPGESGFCRSLSLPSDAPPGQYRFRKDVTVGNSERPKRLTARIGIREVTVVVAQEANLPLTA
jgi:hypothetical protein